jgi:hypothetical protein
MIRRGWNYNMNETSTAGEVSIPSEFEVCISRDSLRLVLKLEAYHAPSNEHLAKFP